MDLEGVEVDVETVTNETIRPRRKYRRKTHLFILQRRNYKKYTPVTLKPTVQFKSSRQLWYERRQDPSDECTHSLQYKVGGENVQKCLDTLVPAPSLPHSSADDAETDYYSDGEILATCSSYVQGCIRELASSNTLTKVLCKCEHQGVTRNFMALIKQIANS